MTTSISIAKAKNRTVKAKTAVKAKIIKKAAKKTERHELFGYSPMSILRWMGAHGMNAAEATAALEAHGLKGYSVLTIKDQVSRQQNPRGAIAPLTREQGARLLKFKTSSKKISVKPTKKEKKRNR